MKKVIIVTLLLVISIHISFAQKEGFVAISILGGPSSCWTSSSEIEDVTGIGFDLKIGHRFNSNFQLSTGVTYFTTGYSRNLAINMPPPVYYEEYKYAHFLIPVELGYSFRLGEKFRLIPSVNIGISHLLGGSYFSQTDQMYRENLSKSTIRNNYCSFTGWAGTALHFSYNFSDRISIVSGVQCNTMVTTFAKGGVSYFNGELMYIVAGDIGIKYSF